MKPAAVIAYAMSIVAVACASARPVKIAEGDQCFRCKRIITDARLGAETLGSSGLVSKFKAPGCMATYLASHPSPDDALWVTDYTTGKMIPPKRATFVPVIVNRDTGERDFRAYLDPRHAEVAAMDFHTAPTNWEGVLAFGRTQ
jgi:hypothetical protein